MFGGIMGKRGGESLAERMIDREIRAANGGALPADRESFEAAARRLDCEVVYHPSPFSASDSAVIRGVIHVPLIGPGEGLHPCYLHELREACQLWEGHAPYVLPRAAAGRSRHDTARCLDLTEPRACRTEARDRRIAVLAEKLAASVVASGFETAWLTVRGGTVRVMLGYLSQPATDEQ